MAQKLAFINRTKKPRSFSPSEPLQCRHYQERSVIVTYIKATDTWNPVAEICPVAGVKHEILAQYICQLINDNLSSKDILQDAKDALQLCLTEASMTFSTEQAADCVVTRIQRVSL